jgi:predicted CoA-substrate-specific enzyme activase
MRGVGLGIDVGTESIKMALVELVNQRWRLVASWHRSHGKHPAATIRGLLADVNLREVTCVAATGRMHSIVEAASLPAKAALKKAFGAVHQELEAATILNIGAHGFSVLELHANGQDYFRQNTRCSQGTGNFLSQLAERFGLSVSEASALCDQVQDPCALSGRCPVILKTDMTHLANQGEDRTRILAGLFDAVCENVITLIRPLSTPPDVLLVGGVSEGPRIRRRIEQWLTPRGLRLLAAREEDRFIEAIGAALHALETPEAQRRVRGIDELLRPLQASRLERVPALRLSMNRVHRMPRGGEAEEVAGGPVIIGLDIGSTGSKAVAVELATGKPIWESYLNTEGSPINAAQRLVRCWLERPGNSPAIAAFGVTGSGREIVGTLLRICYGDDRVFVLNEIAAHARGATSIDPDVDTIFEIGGQDAKYIRLEQGRVVDAAMNEACSAGTGSFIAEQGAKFGDAGLSAAELGVRAIQASHGVALGQHCSVFMADVIDEATAAGETHAAIIAGLYDSVIQNYLNRVKGARTIGNRIFCQGMPFASDALAAAVARQTQRDVIVPPNPGTIGALGIALLAFDERADALAASASLDCSRFLEAAVDAKETIVCRSTKGCGAPGNRCRIDRISASIQGVSKNFLWGGSCSLYDRGSSRRKLEDGAPDPFKELDAYVTALLADEESDDDAPSVALCDEFAFKGMTPFWFTFLRRLGLRCHVLRHAGVKTLRTGIETAGTAYCAPMQMVHGIQRELLLQNTDYVLLPVFRGLPRVSTEEHSTLCPMVIASSDILAALGDAGKTKLLRPLVDFDAGGFDGPAIRECMKSLAGSLDRLEKFESAFREAGAAQLEYEQYAEGIGRRALDYCQAHDVVPVAVLGRPYTIHNDVLNSNVPAILRQLGAVAIPVDCIPVDHQAPTYGRQYWGHTQRNLRVAELVRRTAGLYAVFCSNYACGPDSFTLHFFAYTMQGKPYAVVETDGHSGDAGTRTRMEAFLYCVDTDRKSKLSERAPRQDFSKIEQRGWSWDEARARRDKVLVPRMGPQAEVAAAALRADGFDAEALPLSTREDVRVGRQHTSGKECLPMMLTLGTLLNRVRSKRDGESTYAFFMPTACGPCRFGVYNSLHKIVLERLGLDERVRVISPSDADYFEGTRPDFAARLWIGFLVHDLLQSMRHYVQPIERQDGMAQAIYSRYFERLVRELQVPSKGTLTSALGQLASGMWGMRELVREAAREFADARGAPRRVPTVALVGEIYVRLDPFANDQLVKRLEAHGLRVQFAPFVEWLEYSNHLSEQRLLQGRGISSDDPLKAGFTGMVQRVTSRVLHGVCERALGWSERTEIPDVLLSGERFVHPALTGEAVLTVGGPMHEFERGQIDAVVVVGPHECMPCKVAEARFARIGETHRLPQLAVYSTGDGIDTEAVDRFAFDLWQQYRENVSMGRALGMTDVRELRPCPGIDADPDASVALGAE